MQASGVDMMPLVTALYPVRGPPTRLYTCSPCRPPTRLYIKPSLKPCGWS